METEDFERLKALCQENDFELLNVDHEDNEKFYVIAKKKDPWDGVDFGEVIQDGNHVKKGQIFKLLELSKGILWSKFNHYRIGELGKDSTIWISQEILKPSTESAYIDQLKKEAFERFGEIKEWDRFDTTYINSELSKKTNVSGSDFEYQKNTDSLYVGNKFIGTCIYQQGRWATRVKERVKVGQMDYRVSDGIMTLNFHLEKAPKDYPTGLMSFMGQKLEEFFNK